MQSQMKGWTGKRLIVDLSLHRAWTEEIPDEDRETYWGGRGLNGKFFLDRIGPGITPASPENPIVFGLGPLAGTLAPCSGWTSISTISPISSPPRYAHVGLPGHWGPQLKFAGSDQLIITGKAEKPIYLAIEGEGVSFEDAKPIWRKDTVETTVAIQEEKKDRNIEVLCIGPAGENLVSFANLTNRFSWTADHIGLGYIFGAKNLKAIAIRGNIPVHLHNPDRFLQTCLALIEKMQRDPNATRLKKQGAFIALRQGSGRLGIKNFNEWSNVGVEERWGSNYLANYFHGQEGCFSCPIHCGRVSEVDGNYFGGVHFESAWSLGPRIGIEDWEKTLLIHRVCQLQGLDPTAAGTLLSWVMDCFENGILSVKELGSISCPWGDEKAALQFIEWIVEKKEMGEILSQGGLRAASFLGKGAEQVSHCWGMDLPVQDPRSSGEYTLSRILFPFEWDYLQSVSNSSLLSCKGAHSNGALKGVLALENLKVLADLNSLCPLIIARIPLVLDFEIGELLAAATGKELDENRLMESVHMTLRVERALGQRFKPQNLEYDPLPARFFKDPSEKNRIEKEAANYETIGNDRDLVL